MLTCSPAPGRPWLNSGIETPANACQMLVPEPNHLENSVLCVPYCPVIVKVGNQAACATPIRAVAPRRVASALRTSGRSEEHTSELQSLAYLVCRLLLEKKKKKKTKTLASETTRAD